MGEIFVNDEATLGIKGWIYGSLWRRSRVFTDFKSIASLTSNVTIMNALMMRILGASYFFTSGKAFIVSQ